MAATEKAGREVDPGGETVRALREVASYVRTNLKKRAIFAAEAGVTPLALDNFLTKRRGKREGVVRFRTITPSQTFQINLLRYLAGLPEVAAVGRKRSHPLHKKVRLITSAVKALDVGRSEDLLFRVLREAGLTDETTSRSIADGLLGSFYAYRRSSQRRGYIVKSFIQVQPMQMNNMTPTFTHYRKERDDKKTVRITKGVILDISNHYYFMGFVRGSSNYAGIKVIIVPHASYGRSQQMTGLFLSHDIDESYDFGMMRLVRTHEVYSRARIGLFLERKIDEDLSNLALKMPLDSFDVLRADPSTLAMSINAASPAVQQSPESE